MIPPGRIDIGATGLMGALANCMRPMRRWRAVHTAEGALLPTDEALAVLSVRSGFDLLLQALALPVGSEVVVSALTIDDMVRIVRAHGLVPVPVDLDMTTLSVPTEALEAAITPGTGAVVVAHVFGSRMPLGPISELTQRQGLLLIEDCAQAFDGRHYLGAPGADVVMFSFGPIKTQTCLGGGLLRVRDQRLLERMRDLHQQWPVQPGAEYLVRVVKYLGIKALLTRVGYTAFVSAVSACGGGHETVLRQAVRGFAGPAFFRRIRRQPSVPLLRTMAGRLDSDVQAATDTRKRIGDAVIDRIPHLTRPGERADHHTHWVFPVCVRNGDEAIVQLQAAGLDATRGATSLTVVPTAAERPERSAPKTRDVMDRVIFLPVYPGMPPAALDRLIAVLSDLDRPVMDHV